MGPREEARVPYAITPLPDTSWEDLEAIFDSLAESQIQKESVHHLLAVTRSLSPYLSKLDLLREIICIALVLLPENDRPPETWDWLTRGPAPPGSDVSSRPC